jgi:hypothetical protein
MMKKYLNPVKGLKLKRGRRKKSFNQTKKVYRKRKDFPQLLPKTKTERKLQLKGIF